MIPGFDLAQFTSTAGPLAAILLVGFIIFAESGLLVGFFLPGDSIIFTLGFLLQSMDSIGFGINIHIVFLFLFICAAIGDNTGYAFGNRVGPHIFNKPNSLLFKKENVKRAQDFYDKHGKKTIILARFVPIVRTFVPVVAGVGKMEYKTFFTFNLIGAGLWTGVVLYLGYFLGAWLTSIGVDVDAILLPIVLAIVLISVSPALYAVLKDKKRRETIWDTTKTQLKKIIKRK